MTTRALIAFHNKLVEAPAADGSNVQIVAALQCELMRLGYILDEEAFHALSRSPIDYLTGLYTELLVHARELKGADVKYSPFWVNFPNDVISKSDLELYMSAILHYWSDGTWTPAQELKARHFEFETKTFTTVKLAKAGWLEQVASNLSTFTKPLDSRSVEDLKFIVQNVPFEFKNVSVKETQALIVANGGKLRLTSATDVLRVAVAMSDGDVSLSKLPTDPEERRALHFKKFKRSERRQILGLLEALPYVDAGDMQPHLGRWIRLAEVLHPGEFAKQFPKSAAAFHALRNQKVTKVRTFAGRVDLAFAESVELGIKTLAERPGEMARKMDWLLRTHTHHSDTTLKLFAGLIGRVSTKVVFEMRDHFEGRRVSQPRTVMLKGSGSSSRVLEDLAPLPLNVIDKLQDMLSADLLRRAAQLPKLKKVYIDPELENMPIPYAMQSTSEGAVAMVRGTRFQLSPETNTIRGFTHWYDQDGRIDVDLGATFMDTNFNVKGEVTFYELRAPGFNAHHSGDVRHRRGHNAEYVDFDIAAAKGAGVRYVLFSVYNYDGSPMAFVPQATFGIMERSAPQSNEIFEPATCPQAIKIKCASTMCVPVLLDLEKNQFVWIDMESEGRTLRDTNFSSMKAKLACLLGNVKFNVADLLFMHVAARGGELVDDPAQADEAFTMADFSTDYTKLAPYMAI